MNGNFKLSADLPSGVRAWMSTRAGGISSAPYDSLNLGDHVGDVPQCVQANRRLLAQTLGVRPVFLKQVHGTTVLELTQESQDGSIADACFSFAPRIACTVLVADCLPVLMWDANARWVAAAHAGWRGLADGVLESLWQALAARGAQLQHTRVWLGPCIGPQKFEVGPEIKALFMAQDPAWHAAFRAGRGDRLLADLPALARARLQRMGVTQVLGNNGSTVYCTVSQPTWFFSHRRDAVGGYSTGRMAASIWVQGI